MSNFKKRMESYRRHPGSFLLFLLVMLSALATFVVLLFLIAYILIKGVPNLKPSLFPGRTRRKMLLCCLPS